MRLGEGRSTAARNCDLGSSGTRRGSRSPTSGFGLSIVGAATDLHAVPVSVSVTVSVTVSVSA